MKKLPDPDPQLLFHPELDTQYVFFENSQSFPFVPDATSFNKANAAWLADAALLAYWPSDGAKPKFAAAGLTDYSFLNQNGTQCHVASNDQFAIVCFRGTQPDQWQDVLADVEIAESP